MKIGIGSISCGRTPPLIFEKPNQLKPDERIVHACARGAKILSARITGWDRDSTLIKTIFKMNRVFCVAQYKVVLRVFDLGRNATAQRLHCILRSNTRCLKVF